MESPAFHGKRVESAVSRVELGFPNPCRPRPCPRTVRGFPQLTPLRSPGLRVLVEGVVMVGSTLLAFGLQVLWDRVQERARNHATNDGDHR